MRGGIYVLRHSRQCLVDFAGCSIDNLESKKSIKRKGTKMNVTYESGKAVKFWEEDDYKEGCLSDADLFSANDMRLTEKQREDFLRNKKFVEEVFDSQ